MISYGKNGLYYRIDGIAPLVAGTAAKTANRIDYSGDPSAVRRAEKALLKSMVGIEERNIIILNQMHEDLIVPLDRYPDSDRLVYADADGMITALPGLCLVIRTADCVPVCAFDVRQRVLGAVHSGWRGCKLAIAGKLIGMMKSLFSSRESDIEAFLLPSIGPHSYTVGAEVATLFPDDITRRGGRMYLDLWKNISAALEAAGVPGEKIHVTGLCTMRNRDEFFSHRNADIGRNLNFACISGC